MKLRKVLKLDGYRNEWEKLLLNFQLNNVLLNAHLKDSFGPYGITFQQYNVLKIIATSEEEAVTNNYIKQRLVERDSDISRLLRRLTDLEYISKSINAVDKRRAEIRLTEKGEKVLNDLAKNIHVVDRFFYNLSKKEAKALNKLLAKIRG